VQFGVGGILPKITASYSCQCANMSALSVMAAKYLTSGGYDALLRVGPGVAVDGESKSVFW
jgi:hypothetical protein